MGLFFFVHLQQVVGLQDLAAAKLVLLVHQEPEVAVALSHWHGLLVLPALLRVGCVLRLVYSLESTGGALLTCLTDVLGQCLVGLPQLTLAMGKAAVLVELATSFVEPELAELSLVVVVGNVHHAVHQLLRERVLSAPELCSSVSKVAVVAFLAMTVVLLEVLAQLGLVVKW